MDDNQLDKENPEYDKIRHFKANWKDYKDFWKKKGARMTPWEEWDQEYPKKKKMKKSDPVHSYKTFDDESKGVNEAKSVEQSAGFAIVYEGKVLLGHATGKGWWKSYSIPKGHLEPGETILQAALRETYEEIGVKIPKRLIPSSFKTCPYIKKGNHWKDVYYYVIVIDSLGEIGLNDEVIPKGQLQLKEIDWAGFVPLKEALKRIAPVMKPIIEGLMIYNNDTLFKKFESFCFELNEDNMVALAGSQEDRIPMPKPFVLKSKKKRKGSNEDDDDETQEVANMTTK